MKKLVRDKTGEKGGYEKLSPKEFKNQLIKEINYHLKNALYNKDRHRYQQIAEAQERFQMLVTALVPRGKHQKAYEMIMMSGRNQALDGGFFSKYYEEIADSE